MNKPRYRVVLASDLIEELAQRLLNHSILIEEGPPQYAALSARVVAETRALLTPQEALAAEARSVVLRQIHDAEQARRRDALVQCRVCLHFEEEDDPVTPHWCTRLNCEAPCRALPCSSWAARG